MINYKDLLSELFTAAKGDITLELADGTIVTSSDLDELADAAASGDDPWVDLVTSDGEAIGIFLPGDHESAEPQPSFDVQGGMIYMIDGSPVPDQAQGKHICPLDVFAGKDGKFDADGLNWYVPEDLDIATPASSAPVRLSTGRSRQEQQGKWKMKEASFGLFADMLLEHAEGKKDGTCYLQGECAGGARKAAAMIANYVLGVDLDSGAPINDVMATIIDAGLEAVIYTTNSHLKETSVIKKDGFIKWSGEGTFDPENLDLIREYLITKKGVLPEILEGLTILDDAQHTEDGIVILVQHKPMPKFRAVFPLSEPFVFAKRGGTQQDAIAEWKERYAGFCSALGLFFDETCVDPARLFYFPRHKRGAPFDTWHVIGKALDLDQYERVKMKRGRDGKRRAVAQNAFSAAGEGQDEDDLDRYVTSAEGYNLRAWAAKNAKRFEVETMLQDLQPEMVREGRGNKAGVHISCPFEDEHTNFGGGGTFVVNASDALDEGYDSGFAIVCTHNACSGRDRLDFIKGFIDEELITVEDINDKAYRLELEDDEDEEEDDDDGVPWDTKDNARTRKRSTKSEGYERGDNQTVDYAQDLTDDSDFGDSEQSMLKAFNRRYAVIVTSGGVKILREPMGDGDDDDVMFLSQNDVGLLEKKRVFYRQGSDKKMTKVEAFKAWLEWENRRTYRNIVFAPGRRAAPGIYNLFRGWPVQAKSGSWDLLRTHVFENMCASDPIRFNWFMTWLSHLVQKPDQKPGSTVVITGEKGTGKSTLFDYVNRLLGKHGITVAQRKQIVGQFNGHLATTLLMVCEEAFWAADPQAEGVLKDMITNKSVLIEKKGYDPVQSQNYTRLALISNNEWVVPASLKDERRFFVLHCSAARRGDTAFFDALRYQMEHEGGLEAMMHELMTWEPFEGTWASLFKPPITEHLQKQQIETLQGVHKFMLELVKSGLYESANPNLDTIELSEDEETRVWAVDMRAAVEDYVRNRFASDKAKTSFDDISAVVMDWFGARETKAHVDGSTNMKRVFIFPPLAEARAKLKETKGLDLEAMPVEELRKLSKR